MYVCIRRIVQNDVMKICKQASGTYIQQWSENVQCPFHSIVAAKCISHWNMFVVLKIQHHSITLFSFSLKQQSWKVSWPKLLFFFFFPPVLTPWGATEVVSIIILSIVVSLQSLPVSFLMKLLWHLPNCFSYSIMFECVVHNLCYEFWQLLQARYSFSMQIFANWNFLQPFYILHISWNRGRVCVSMQWPCSSRVWLSSTKA